MLEQLAQYLPEEHRNMAGLLATASSSQVSCVALSHLPGPCLYAQELILQYVLWHAHVSAKLKVTHSVQADQ